MVNNINTKDLKNTMKWNILFLALLVMGTFVVSASPEESYPIQEVDTNFTFCQICANANYITLSSIQTPDNLDILNANMTPTGNGQFCYNYTLEEVGTYDFRGISDGCLLTYAVHVPVTQSGTPNFQFMSFTLMYLIVLIISYVLVYKFATFNGKGVKEGLYYYWAAFLDLVLFVILEVYGFGGAGGLLVDVIKILSFGSGLTFLALGMIDSIWGWNKNK